jgi:hypothetical protein
MIQHAQQVRSLAVKISSQAAEKKLAPSITNWLWPRPLARLALAYVPFATFDAEVEAVNFKQRYSLSMEAVAGKLDPYRTEGSAVVELQQYETANALPSVVAEPDLERRSRDVIRRETYVRGFARIKQLKIRSVRRTEKDFYVPFWIGFYGQEDVQLRVVNAHTGNHEGRKACQLFEQWLAR